MRLIGVRSCIMESGLVDTVFKIAHSHHQRILSSSPELIIFRRNWAQKFIASPAAPRIGTRSNPFLLAPQASSKAPFPSITSTGSINTTWIDIMNYELLLTSFGRSVGRFTLHLCVQYRGFCRFLTRRAPRALHMRNDWCRHVCWKTLALPCIGSELGSWRGLLMVFTFFEMLPLSRTVQTACSLLECSEVYVSVCGKFITWVGNIRVEMNLGWIRVRKIIDESKLED